MSRLPITSTLKKLTENHYQYSVFRTCRVSKWGLLIPLCAICSLPACLLPSLQPAFSLSKPHKDHSECWERPRPSQPPPSKVSKSFDWEPERKKSERLLPLFLKEGNRKQGRGGQQKDIHTEIHTHIHIHRLRSGDGASNLGTKEHAHLFWNHMWVAPWQKDEWAVKR